MTGGSFIVKPDHDSTNADIPVMNNSPNSVGSGDKMFYNNTNNDNSTIGSMG